MRKLIMVLTTAGLLLTNSVMAEGFRIQTKDVNTLWGEKTELIVTSMESNVTITGVDINRGNCITAWPETPKVGVKDKADKYARMEWKQRKEIARVTGREFTEPEPAKQVKSTKNKSTVWHPYGDVTLNYGQSKVYLITRRCEVLEVVLQTTAGEFAFGYTE